MPKVFRGGTAKQLIQNLGLPRRVSRRITLTDCPPEIIFLVLACISEESLEALVCLMLVCKKVYAVAQSPDIWHIACCSRWRMAEEPAEGWKLKLRKLIELRRKWDEYPATVVTLDGHTDSVYSIELIHDLICTGSRDRTLRLWSLKGYRHLSTHESGHNGSVLTISAGYDILATGGSDGTVVIRSCDDFRILWRVQLHQSGILGLAVGPENCAAASKDGSIIILNTRCYSIHRKILDAHSGKPVSDIAYNASTRTFYSAGGDGKIHLWNMQEGSKLFTLRGHKKSVTCLRVCGHTLVSGASDYTVRVWDLRSNRCRLILRGHENIVRSVDISGGIILSASYDRTINGWDSATGNLLTTYRGWHDGWIYSVRATASAIISASVGIHPVVLDFSDQFQCENK